MQYNVLKFNAISIEVYYINLNYSIQISNDRIYTIYLLIIGARILKGNIVYVFLCYDFYNTIPEIVNVKVKGFFTSVAL